MDNQELEMMTYDCQIGMYFSGIEKLKNGFVVYSTIVEDEHWNFFTGFEAGSIEEFEEAYGYAKEFLSGKNRRPCFVLSPLCNVSEIVENYIKAKYTKISTDSTMLTSEFKQKEPPQDYTFKLIDNKKEKELFIKTFRISKTQTSATDTYAALPEYYFAALEKSFDNVVKWEHLHYLSCYKGQPVGMVSAVVKDDFCGLYGGGTFLAHRGKGVFSSLLCFIENDLKSKGFNKFFGLTEKDSYNEKLYNSLGWKTIFHKEYFV